MNCCEVFLAKAAVPLSRKEASYVAGLRNLGTLL